MGEQRHPGRLRQPAGQRDRHRRQCVRQEPGYVGRGALARDQTALGEPASQEEERDRVLTYLARTLTHDNDQPLITEELEGPVQPITPASDCDTTLTAWLTTHDGPAATHRRTTGPGTTSSPDDETLDVLAGHAGVITAEGRHDLSSRGEHGRQAGAARDAEERGTSF